MAFREIGVELEFSGTGIHEKAIAIKISNQKYDIEVGSEVLGLIQDILGQLKLTC